MELFARRARTNNHPDVLKELRMIVMHLIDREYKSEIDQTLDFSAQLIQLAILYRGRLTSLIAHWLRIGYCQGNLHLPHSYRIDTAVFARFHMFSHFPTVNARCQLC